MASVKAKVFTEHTVPETNIIENNFKFETHTIIYVLITITILLFIRKLILTFCRRRDRLYEAKYE
jgi:hypothetical protein